MVGWWVIGSERACGLPGCTNIVVRPFGERRAMMRTILDERGDHRMMELSGIRDPGVERHETHLAIYTWVQPLPASRILLTSFMLTHFCGVPNTTVEA
jgi:hypothetical protein